LAHGADGTLSGPATLGATLALPEEIIMADTVLAKPEPQAFDNFIRAQALAIHAKDEAPANRRVWEERRAKLRAGMFKAMGPFPAQPCPLEVSVLGILTRAGYRIEKLIFQSRPDVWVTANAYVPDRTRGKVPGVLAVHGHWPWARRDPVVQARCLGLVKLGFFVLAVDAFGSGERYTEPAAGTYHGALYGSTLWPVGQTLLGMQMYDNRRAVDYLQTRPEVDGGRLGITGASGGGNQSMYAGALDERFGAVGPVCSLGTYQAYLHAACCVCEVLPGALRFCEEGDVLGLTAPRSLLVINATKDAFQFSPGEAEKSVARAQKVYRLFGAEERLRHAIFESPHDYNRAMREAMYGWMTRWLKNEGDGKPIPEPTHQTEKVEELSCFPDKKRPKGFLFPPSFAAREARTLLAPLNDRPPDHRESWESLAARIRGEWLGEVLGEMPAPARPVAALGKSDKEGNVTTTPIVLRPEPGMVLPTVWKSAAAAGGKRPVCLLLHLDGKSQAFKHAYAKALLAQNWIVISPDLRATGETRPEKEGIKQAADHNSAEHALWIGRPLLGQWLVDLRYLLGWLALQPDVDRRFIIAAGVGHASIVALCAAAFLEGITGAVSLGGPVTLVTESAYGPKMRMGLLAPGMLRSADIPHLAALIAPRRLIIADGVSPQDRNLRGKEIQEALSFTGHIYRLFKAEGRLTVTEDPRFDEIAAALAKND
jgi:dienelactone hydrolase